jgi:hypothetical protein
MKSPITDASRMTAIRKLSPFSIVCRIGNLNGQFGWLQRLNLNRRTLAPAHFVQMLRSPDELHVAIKISNEKSAIQELMFISAVADKKSRATMWCMWIIDLKSSVEH